MTAPGTLSFSDMKTLALKLAHMNDSSLIGDMGGFLNDTYETVWSDSEDWIFRWASVNVSVTANSQTVTNPPADLGLVSGLWRGSIGAGDRLTYIDPDVFISRYLTAAVGSGPPCEYTVIDQQILVGPTSNETASDYTLLHKRRFTPLVNDTDVPVLPVGTHMVLVYGAAATGLISENDFFFQFCDGRYQQRIEAMRREYRMTTSEEAAFWPSLGESWPVTGW